MRTLRAWSRKPGMGRGDLPDFVAGAITVTESAVYVAPHADGAMSALALTAVVPASSEPLSALTAAHEREGVEGLDYISRWGVLIPNTHVPYALARLDIRIDAPPITETRLLFDIALHNSDLWAVAHTGLVRLVSPDRIEGQNGAVLHHTEPRSLVLDTDASPLTEWLAKLGINDPFVPLHHALAG